jgi:hypothetical protein
MNAPSATVRDSFVQRVRDRLLRERSAYCRFYRAKRFYTALLSGPGGPFKRVATLARRLAHPRAMLIYPETPQPDSVVHKICCVLNLRLTRDLAAPADGAMFYEDLEADKTHARPDAAIRALGGRRFVANLGCTDVSKVRVERAFVTEFGYSSFVDPETHAGVCVMKSDLNALHDGRIIRCPAPREPGVVYQKVLNNETGGGFVVDHRVPVFRGHVPFVYLKHRPLETRFSNTNAFVRIAQPDAVFSADELAGIVRFCAAIGLDYGELDVLRDKADGRIYIIDVSKTPWGPPNHLTPWQEDWCLARFADFFERHLMVPETAAAQP